MNDSRNPAAYVIARCDQLAPNALWTPGDFYLEHGARDQLEALLPRLKVLGVRRYAAGALDEYDDAVEAIGRTVARRAQGDLAARLAPAVPGGANPLAVVYSILVRNGARLPAADGFGPTLLSPVESSILQALFDSVGATGQWPTLALLEVQLSDAGLADNLREATAGIGSLLEHVKDQNNDQRLGLSFPGLAFVPKAARDLETVAQVVRATGAIYNERIKAGQKTVTIPLLEAVSRGAPAADVQRLGLFLRCEQPLLMGGYPDHDPKNAYFGSGLEFVRVAKATDVPSLIRTLHPHGVFMRSIFAIGAESGRTRPLLAEASLEFIDGQLGDDGRDIVERVHRAGDRGARRAYLKAALGWPQDRFDAALSRVDELGLLARAPGAGTTGLLLTESGRLTVEHWRRSASDGGRTTEVTVSSYVSQIQLFVSHAWKNLAIAKPFTDLLEVAFEVPDGTIRCTSVPGYTLKVGDTSDDVLRADIRACRVMVALVTPESQDSDYALFELGGGWVLEKPTFVLVHPKVEQSKVQGPAGRLHNIRLDNRAGLAQLLDTIHEKTGWPWRPYGPKRAAAIEALVEAATRP